MIDRKQFLGLMAGAPILMRAGMAEAVELPDAQKRLTLVVDTVVRDENGNEKTRTRSRETIFTPESKTVSADAMAGDVITIQRESDETLPLLAKIELTVAYYNDKTEIEIRSGKYSIVQIDPLVMYANAWYALMQKDKYVMNYFTESEASYETGWGPTPYDAEKDKWTCGSGMGAMITDFINDSTYNFAIDCYIE
jgi:hypothetical protein